MFRELRLPLFRFSSTNKNYPLVAKPLSGSETGFVPSPVDLLRFFINLEMILSRPGRSAHSQKDQVFIFMIANLMHIPGFN